MEYFYRNSLWSCNVYKWRHKNDGNMPHSYIFWKLQKKVAHIFFLEKYIILHVTSSLESDRLSFSGSSYGNSIGPFYQSTTYMGHWKKVSQKLMIGCFLRMLCEVLLKNMQFNTQQEVGVCCFAWKIADSAFLKKFQYTYLKLGGFLKIIPKTHLN